MLTNEGISKLKENILLSHRLLLDAWVRYMLGSDPYLPALYSSRSRKMELGEQRGHFDG